ncbi:GAF domain-containing protein [Haloplanus sp. GCM10025708]|uniref:sensor histidine kinase n=1 Tax=Haloplanus sp. GCM10025708 TaxID=3252679 RepID=UPI00360D4426
MEAHEGTRMPERYPAAVVDDLEPVFRAAVEDGETESVETTFADRNWRVWATPLRDADGEIFAGLGLAQDITEQVERKAQLRRSNEQLAARNRLNQIARDINWQLAQQSTREEIEAAVCEHLAESDAYEFAWIGVADGDTDEVVPSAAANAQGYLDEVTITVDESPTGRGPTGTALRTGESQIVHSVENAPEYDPWREQAAERGIRSSAAIPIVYEDQQYGVLNVYSTRERAFDDDKYEVLRQLGEITGLAIAAFERERQVHYERERLEFVNRLLRHNLLNGLNVIQAQAGLLEPHVRAEGSRYLETVRKRADDLISLIETMRSLMAIVTDENQELQAVDLESILREELQQVSKSYRDAEFELRGDLGDVDAVHANEVLPEVFENLLVNAVRHNDAETPEVTVSVESAADTVTVHVEDNGPGVPDELKDRVFEKGEKNFDSPGTGFGLYLAREIVESCGGTISVADGDTTGAVFSVSLQRA